MDELKKSSESARNSIRWLEREFTKGSRFIRLQRNNESKPLSLIKIPKKLGKCTETPPTHCPFSHVLLNCSLPLDRDASTFVQIAQFCNFLNDNHVTNGGNGDNCMKNGASPNVVTLITGIKLSDKKATNFSYTGIMNALSINFEQISTFYAKYKKK